jgi:hypothetical protein
MLHNTSHRTQWSMECNNIHLLHAAEGNMKIYSPKSIIFPEGNARGKYDTRGWINFIFSEPACYKCFIIPNETKKTHTHVNYCWQTYFKSIGTLSQTFKHHIHNNIVTVACKWDAFRVPLTFSCQRTITLSGKPVRLPKGWNMIFISRNMIFVLCDHVFWFLPIVQSN